MVTEVLTIRQTPLATDATAAATRRPVRFPQLPAAPCHVRAAAPPLSSRWEAAAGWDHGPGAGRSKEPGPYIQWGGRSMELR